MRELSANLLDMTYIFLSANTFFYCFVALILFFCLLESISLSSLKTNNLYELSTSVLFFKRRSHNAFFISVYTFIFNERFNNCCSFPSGFLYMGSLKYIFRVFLI